ncbi:hypothetical protein T440DRAFT_536676 [Plenodomus tracheiphilus IPT5]|uniref:Uncharacterized protein n=1 Tax=Plenodomus tracheiphilus IPT5 TaxID=1408161 RepID=A0A6A7B244_9PLEO|nr:hypothetical protein T440DRAFT_536676 [Plenodomus tracheiphilus IPT5]
MKSFVPILLLPSTLALVARDLQPRHKKPWNTQPWDDHHGTAYPITYLPTITTTITITTTTTTTLTLPIDLYTTHLSSTALPTANQTDTTLTNGEPITQTPTPNDLPPVTLITLSTFSPANTGTEIDIETETTSADPATITAVTTTADAVAPTPNEIPPVQLISIA